MAVTAKSCASLSGPGSRSCWLKSTNSSGRLAFPRAAAWNICPVHRLISLPSTVPPNCRYWALQFAARELLLYSRFYVTWIFLVFVPFERIGIDVVVDTVGIIHIADNVFIIVPLPYWGAR